MCRDKDHGDRRCNSDTSENRRLRRKAANARESHTPMVSVKGGLVEPSPDLATIEDIRAEAAEISKLLSAPVDSSPEVQARIDAENERRVTRLGLAMGEEAERRAGYDREAIEREIATPGEEIRELNDEIDALEAKKKFLMRQYSEYSKTDEAKAGTDFSKGELERLQNETMEVHRESLIAKNKLPAAKERELERQKQVPVEAALRLSEAYKSVISDVRPVGGDIATHELTEADAQQLLVNTVGKEYPSAWLKDSSDAGAIVVKSENGRASYNPQKEHPDPNGPGIPVVHRFRVNPEDVPRYREAFKDDPSFSDDTPIMGNPGGEKQMLVISERVPFDSSKDSSDANGNPVGEQWKKGYVVDKEGSLSSEPVWYSTGMKSGVQAIPTVTVALNRSEIDAKASAYHEFAHRLEDSVGGGVIKRLEEAFDVRRTTDANGNREPLGPVFPDRAEMRNEIGRRDSYIVGYVGKVYPAARTREVFTVGTETVFSGKYGAFAGLPNEKGITFKADADHRAFILGTFATA